MQRAMVRSKCLDLMLGLEARCAFFSPCALRPEPGWLYCQQLKEFPAYIKALDLDIQLPSAGTEDLAQKCQGLSHTFPKSGPESVRQIPLKGSHAAS